MRWPNGSVLSATDLVLILLVHLHSIKINGPSSHLIEVTTRAVVIVNNYIIEHEVA